MEQFLSEYINSKAQRFNSEADSCTADLQHNDTWTWPQSVTRWAIILSQLIPIRNLTLILCFVFLFSA